MWGMNRRFIDYRADKIGVSKSRIWLIILCKDIHPVRDAKPMNNITTEQVGLIGDYVPLEIARPTGPSGARAARARFLTGLSLTR